MILPGEVYMEPGSGINPEFQTYNYQKWITGIHIRNAVIQKRNERICLYLNKKTSIYLVNSEFKYAIPINSSDLPPYGRK